MSESTEELPLLSTKHQSVLFGTLADLNSQEAEREALSNLFAGAIGSYKNPHSHRNVELEEPLEAAEIIMLASHLLRIVQARRGELQQ